MKDIVLKGYLEDFKSDKNLDSLEESKLFECFVNFNIIFNHYDKIFDLDDVSTGGDADLGIDGIAILVNGKLACSVEEYKDITMNSEAVETTFIFIQAKTSSSFDGSEVGTFLYGVEEFFKNDSKVRKNEKIKEFQEIYKERYKKINPRYQLPVLKLFYVTTGKWQNPQDIINRAESGKQSLKDMNLFSDVQFEFYGGKEISDLYNSNSRRVEKSIIISNPIALPEILKKQNVKQAFLGCVLANDYLSLLMDEDGNLMKELFCDNVRDFQGDNAKVNKKILDTMQNDKEQLLLPLLNNGITIIADKITISGNNFTLSNYQIVNGCQTSHILFEKKGSIKNETSIIIRIIETNDSEVTNKIIQATNSQTEVKEEAFESLKEFHKRLQDFYKTNIKRVKTPIYYERRSKEFMNIPEIKSYQVVSLSKQIKAYVATEMKQPHSTRRYFGALLTSNSKQIFTDEKEFGKYYLSAYLVNRIEQILQSLWNEKKISLKWKYMLAYVIYNQICSEIGGFNFEKMLAIIDNENFMNENILSAFEVLQIIAQDESFRDKDFTRNKDFTDKLNDYLENKGSV